MSTLIAIRVLQDQIPRDPNRASTEVCILLSSLKGHNKRWYYVLHWIGITSPYTKRTTHNKSGFVFSVTYL